MLGFCICIIGMFFNVIVVDFQYLIANLLFTLVFKYFMYCIVVNDEFDIISIFLFLVILQWFS